MMKTFLKISIGVLSIICADALAIAPGKDPKIEWIRDHAVPIRSVDIQDDDFSELMPLAKAIGKARIVQLGEATHGDGTTFLAKQRLIRFLHEVMGFDVLVFESPLLACRLMDAAMRDPAKTAYEAAKDNIYGIWAESEQVQGLLEYIKAAQKTVWPLQIVGVDCRLGSSSMKEKIVPEFIINFFDRIDPLRLTKENREEIIKICKTVEYSDYYNKPGKRDLDMSVMHNMVQYLDARIDLVEERSSREEIEFVRQVIQSEIKYEQWCHAVGQKGDNIRAPTRDMIMGENLVWLADRVNPGHKLIVWAHNFHVMEANYLLRAEEDFEKYDALDPVMGPMGHVASRKLGSQVYTIGFLGNSGSWGLANADEKPTEIPPAKEGSLDWYLNQADAPYVFLDFQGLPKDHWLRKPMPARFYFWEENVSPWPRIFDAVFFSREMRPSTKVGLRTEQK